MAEINDNNEPNTNDNNEPNEGNNEQHTAREAELENQIAALRTEMDALRKENRQMFLRLTGRDSDADKDPEQELDDLLLEVLNNRGMTA